MRESIQGGLARPGTGHYRVVLIGRDESLLRTRQEILRRSGFDVETVDVADPVPVDAGDADLVILCQTLHEARSEAIRRSLRERGSRAKVLQMIKRPSEEPDRFCSLDGPAAFLKKVAAMLPEAEGATHTVSA